jgi:hypothetical protein
MVPPDAVVRAVDACREALADYQAGTLDDSGLRKALLDAASRVDGPDVQLDRLVRSALAVPLFTEEALGQLRRSIDRLAAVPTRGSIR